LTSGSSSETNGSLSPPAARGTTELPGLPGGGPWLGLLLPQSCGASVPHAWPELLLHSHQAELHVHALL
jgi:hypothetical protein